MTRQQMHNQVFAVLCHEALMVLDDDLKVSDINSWAWKTARAINGLHVQCCSEMFGDYERFTTVLPMLLHNAYGELTFQNRDHGWVGSMNLRITKIYKHSIKGVWVK